MAGFIGPLLVGLGAGAGNVTNVMAQNQAAQMAQQEAQRRTEEMQARQAEQAMRAMAMKAELDELARSQKLIQGLPADEQSLALLPEPVQKYRATKQRLEKIKDLMNDPNENIRNAARAAFMSGNPDLFDKIATSEFKTTAAGAKGKPIHFVEGNDLVGRDSMTGEEIWRVPGAGAKPMSPQERQALEQADVASRGLDQLLSSAKAVLPMETGLGAVAAHGMRAYKAYAGDPAVTQFNASKTVLINHLRAIAGVARVNQTELEMASQAISGAATYPALEAAVGEAKKRLADARNAILTRAGTGAGPSVGDMGMGMPSAPTPAPTSDWTPVTGKPGWLVNLTTGKFKRATSP